MVLPRANKDIHANDRDKSKRGLTVNTGKNDRAKHLRDLSKQDAEQQAMTALLFEDEELDDNYIQDELGEVYDISLYEEVELEWLENRKLIDDGAVDFPTLPQVSEHVSCSSWSCWAWAGVAGVTGVALEKRNESMRTRGTG